VFPSNSSETCQFESVKKSTQNNAPSLLRVNSHLAVPSTKPEHEVEGRLLLDVVVRESPAIFELLTGEDEPLLVWRDALFVLDLGLDVLDGVRRLDLECDGFSGEGLDKDLQCGFRDVCEIW
jgi:hypothetical protein